MCGIFNFIYGILRNALWDDAAEATSGRFAQHLKYQAEESFSSGVVGPYLSWRFSYLLVGTFFGILSALLGMPWLINADYEAFLARQLPAGVPVARFRTLIQVLQGIDIAAWAILVLLAIGLALGGFWAMPSWAISNVRSSRRVVWCTWLIGFLPPFLLFLVLPLRGFVDWKGISADVCAQSVVSTYRMPGSQLHFTLQLLERNNVLEESMKGLVGETPRDWCLAQGRDWHESFYNRSVPCVWLVEDRCRSDFCDQVADAQMTQCLTGCLRMAIQNAPAQRKQMILQAFENCDAKAASQSYSAARLQAQSSAMATDYSTMSEADIINSMLLMQRVTITSFAETITWASVQSEYAVGVLVAMMVGQNLIASALGLASGLTEALLNLKAMFPGNQIGGWLLILTTFQVVPIYMVIFAVFQQLLGDAFVAIAVVAATFYLSVGMHTGYRITSTKSGDEGRWHFYRLIWVEYGLRALFGLALLGAMLIWVFQKNLQQSLLDYIRDDLLTPRALMSIVADFFTRKSLTAVAGTDAMVSAFVQTETWRLKQDAEASQAIAAQDLERLMAKRTAPKE
ncbi:Cell death-inducing p53-target protein 1-like [Durusdinium trenchii]|uniref:Cell death-inducing p53-target protein 1-like n=1 Tax=Durusdinium trenchii TaxID=1381693 RepID=A0ABP0HPV1_9DINO